MPWAALIGGSSSDPAQQYRDPTLRALCVNDTRCYHGSMRIATAATLLRLRCVAQAPAQRARRVWRAAER